MPIKIRKYWLYPENLDKALYLAGLKGKALSVYKKRRLNEWRKKSKKQ